MEDNRTADLVFPAISMALGVWFLRLALGESAWLAAIAYIPLMLGLLFVTGMLLFKFSGGL